MRRSLLVGLLWTIGLMATLGCGKEPASEQPTPMLKGRLPHPKGRTAQAALKQQKPKAP